jgi:putative restriction endonuclease
LHKPLLLLYALARVVDSHGRFVSFRELDKPLRYLLRLFGQSRRSVHPEYPFWRLQRDGLWEVPNGELLPRRNGSKDPLRTALIRRDTQGGFPEQIYGALRDDRQVSGSSRDDRSYPVFPAGNSRSDPNSRKETTHASRRA